MGTAIVAAAAALLGTSLAALIQEWRDRSARREAAAERARQALAAALTELLTAATRNRQRQFAKHSDLAKGWPDSHEKRDDRYEARSRLTDALSALTVLTSDESLLDAARTLAETSIAVGDAEPQQADEAGRQARLAHDAMLRAITRHNHTAR